MRTSDLTAGEIAAIRHVLWTAFDALGSPDEAMTEADWEHALGGMHFLAERDGQIVGHAAVIERRLWIGERPVRTGYVEAVAVSPGRQRAGIGSALMNEVNGYIAERFDLGALGTGVQPFYERLGWRVWQGPTSVRTDRGSEPTPDEDGYILVLPTPSTPTFDPRSPIACEPRSGDAW